MLIRTAVALGTMTLKKSLANWFANSHSESELPLQVVVECEIIVRCFMIYIEYQVDGIRVALDDGRGHEWRVMRLFDERRRIGGQD